MRLHTSAVGAASARVAAAAAAQGAELEARSMDGEDAADVTYVEVVEEEAGGVYMEEDEGEEEGEREGRREQHAQAPGAILDGRLAVGAAAGASAAAAVAAAQRAALLARIKVRRCRLTVSKPVFIAPMVSAISA
jgi:hypothetical protein